MSAATPLTGQRVPLAGTVVQVPVLNLALARKHGATLQALEAGGADELENLPKLIELVGDNLRRIDATITDEQLENWLDSDNLGAVFAAMKGQGSYRAWCEEQAALGNVRPLQELGPTPSPGTGALSTPPSPPPPAGVSPTSTH